MSTTPDDLPDDKFRPDSILDPYRAEIERLRGLLVGLAIEHANKWLMEYGTPCEIIIAKMRDKWSVNLRSKYVRIDGWTFEEDTTK